MEKWIIFDLDGTLADIEARRSLPVIFIHRFFLLPSDVGYGLFLAQLALSAIERVTSGASLSSVVTAVL